MQSTLLRSHLALEGNRKPTPLFETRFARPTSRVVANSSPRQTHERRVLHEGASFAFCTGVFEGWAKAGGHRVSRSLNRRVARTPPLADRMGRKSLWVSRGAGCWVKTGSAPLERSLPSGSGALVRSRTVAKRDPRVMSANVATSLFRSIRLGVRPPTGFPRRRGAELRATMLRARGPRA